MARNIHIYAALVHVPSNHGYLFVVLLEQVYGRYGVLDAKVVRLGNAVEGGGAGHICSTREARFGRRAGRGQTVVGQVNQSGEGEQGTGGRNCF